MRSLLFLILSAAMASSSVIPGWPSYGPAWPDYGAHHHHHVPVATSYANVWKVDHSVPVVVHKPLPAYGWEHSAASAWEPWGTPYGHDPYHHPW